MRIPIEFSNGDETIAKLDYVVHRGARIEFDFNGKSYIGFSKPTIFKTSDLFNFGVHSFEQARNIVTDENKKILAEKIKIYCTEIIFVSQFGKLEFRIFEASTMHRILMENSLKRIKEMNVGNYFLNLNRNAIVLQN